ncbi:SMI1/KNR4 family protein [Streptomyces tendae]|uniref:SMI1/KNR4 family protein n=1 Tax=Streptomyces tendae TaxID=1932 RepID=UPI0037235488
MWVQRLIDLTGWEPLGLSVDWETVEGELQVPLPADYKQLFEAFGGGTFSESVYFFGPSGPHAFNFLAQWRAALEAGGSDDVQPIYSPGEKGVIVWAATEWADEYAWLVDAQNPGVCSVLVRGDVGEWRTYDMSTSEFLYRVLADEEFKPFGIAHHNLDPEFEPGRSLPGS